MRKGRTERRCLGTVTTTTTNILLCQPKKSKLSHLRGSSISPEGRDIVAMLLDSQVLEEMLVSCLLRRRELVV